MAWPNQAPKMFEYIPAHTGGVDHIADGLRPCSHAWPKILTATSGSAVMLGGETAFLPLQGV
ncbi:MAG: hypothetical protein WAT67_09400 [Candidatus Contendobacter sp.]